MRSSKSTFEDGCHAMVPILDTLDSHPRPNVLYTYDSEKQAFVISAKSKISPQYELINSYGKYSDSHLFAKFGFVNGDGSGYTQASMALFHRPFDILMGEDFSLMPNVVMNGKDDESETQSLMDETLNHQRKEMKRYLTMDDGYDDCIQKDLHPEAFKLKRLKLMHLIRMANDPSSWIATLQPRKPRSRPRESINLLISEEPPKFNPSNVQVNLIKLMNTCRLIVLNEEDYDGRAIQILEDNLENKDFVVPEMEGNKALEYRSLKYLGRMTASALMQYTPVKMKQEFETVRQLNKENAFGNSTWTAAQLRLGEMQSLHAVSGIAMTFARKLLEGMEEEQIGVQFKIRESSCPKAYTDILDKDLN
ncbi:unnamed protein product [Pseudo-nitzschia multistriata]|uniref:SET domain-containing protein n=1 Tax=Pseudo-nitzschia multistriata TaxID=183589 RepID=A0A448ZSB2_9STRA|nr:unnamed protein product [Pseudo-nitzschia multistriata]